jgi:hypothetical protein
MGEEPSGETVLRLIQIRLTTPSLERISLICQDNSTASADYRFKFRKRISFSGGAVCASASSGDNPISARKGQRGRRLLSVLRHIKERNTVSGGSEDIRRGRACAASVRNYSAS